MHGGQHGARQGSSEPRAPGWHCQHTESFSYLTPNDLESRLRKEREREHLPREWQGEGLSLPHCQVGCAANPLPGPTTLPCGDGTHVVSCHSGPGKAAGAAVGAPTAWALHWPPHQGSLSPAQTRSVWWVAVGTFWGPSGFLQSHPTSELHWFLPHVFSAGLLEAVGAAPRSASLDPPWLPPCQCGSPCDGSSQLLGKPGAARASVPTSILCPTPPLHPRGMYWDRANHLRIPAPERDRLASSRASIMVQDILTTSQRQTVLQCGYQCMLCCRIFPTLWLVKTQIQHSSQEGYSCNGFYCRLNALGKQELKAQEAAASRLSM
ncbi:PREDICTED: uncharacterized protein C1orf111 homolog [Lepidothrix coronata]|uniref:Uncharacterized protein C1orf111 homolog n=1 Tax=Lepidothrix coronata TaxID=321398 RepID=A0A6J0HAS7_9PASS|nr:PREDICTED: uncharacterized protein C1orf111 homolog [Lepidothrix coronata]